jgi:membrane-bound lytic murein transglycosylase D
MKKTVFLIALILVFYSSYGQQIPSKFTFANLELFIQPEVQDRLTQKVKTWQQDANYLNALQERKFSYFPILLKAFKQHNVPEDMAFLAVQQSNLLQIVGKATYKDKVGLWQLTGTQVDEWRLGLVINKKVDERRHIGLAAEAIAKKFSEDNYTLRNWWNTALSFHTSFMDVARNSPDTEKGAKQLQINDKTPEKMLDLLALMIAFQQNTWTHNLQSISLLEYKETKGQNITDIAKLFGLSVEALKTYNAWLMAESVPTERNYVVYLPVTDSNKAAIQDMLRMTNSPADNNVSNMPKDFPILIEKRTLTINDRTYRVVVANGLEAVVMNDNDIATTDKGAAVEMASINDLKVKKFLKYNDLKEKDTLLRGMPYYLQEKKDRAYTPFHNIAKGETFWSVAQKYGMKLEKLVYYNRLLPNEQPVEGRKLWLQEQRPKETKVEIMPKDATPTLPTSPMVTNDSDFKYYKVQDEETIYEVAANFGLRIDSLRFWNNLPNEINVSKGQKLIIGRKEVTETTTPVVAIKDNNTATEVTNNGQVNNTSPQVATNPDNANSTPANNTSVATQNTTLPTTTPSTTQTTAQGTTITHKVQPKEGLFAIARKYGVSHKDIIADNQLTDTNLKIGQTLVIKNAKQGYTSADVMRGDNATVTMTANTTTPPDTTQSEKPVLVEPVRKPVDVEPTILNDIGKVKNDNSQPFLKDSVYIVEKDGETLVQIAKKFYPNDKGNFLVLLKSKNLDMDIYNYYQQVNPNMSIDENTPYMKGMAILLSNTAVKPSKETIAAAFQSNTANNTTNSTPANTTGAVTSADIKEVRYDDYKDNTYVVQRGDNFYNIAKKTGVTDYRYLLRWNNIKDENQKLQEGEVLKVKGDLSQAINAQPKLIGNRIHIVQLGDNIYSLSKLYKTPEDSIYAWNNLSKVDAKLAVGQQLIVRKNFTHTVKRGETLSKIAALYGVKVEDIATLNKLDVNKPLLKPDDVLLIDRMGVPTATATPTALPSIKNEPLKKNLSTAEQPFLAQDIYLVKTEGETLASISQKLRLPTTVMGTPYTDYMQRWNNIADATKPLGVGTAVKIGEDAVMPSYQELQKALKNSVNAANNGVKLNEDALLPPPQAANTSTTVPQENNVAVAGKSNNTTAPTPTVMPEAAQPFKDIHIVTQPNENLKTIAKKYNKKPIAGYDYYLYMKTYNNIADEDAALPLGTPIKLTEGAIVPSPQELANYNKTLPPPMASKTAGMHTVEQGENLYTIAQQYNVDYRYLIAWNKLDKNEPLKAGTTLQVQGDLGVELPQYDKFYTDRYHIVQSGETVYEIAAFHKIPLDEFLKWNKLTRNSKLQEGQQLWIIAKPKMHTAWQGETLQGIADQYGITLAQLYEWNNLEQNYVLKQGDVLIIDETARLNLPTTTNNNDRLPPPQAGRSEATTGTIPQEEIPDYYYAQVGERLQDVCTRFGVSTIDFKLLNKLPYETDKLEEGKKYFLKETQQTLPPPQTSSPAVQTVSYYTVGKEDTLYSIARKFNISVYDLRDWNKMGETSTVKEGDKIIVGQK